jgi:hypothetical protein
MAEPLTSSDIQRERMGFGISPMASPETRRAYAAAGLQPLTTQDRERFESGGGISPMAGTAEKEAWKMSEYMAGDREQAPIEYGGIGDRPTGSSRRALRMQAQWDEQQKQMLERERLQQQMDINMKQYEIQAREAGLRRDDFFYKRGLSEAEQKIKAEITADGRGFIEGLNELNPKSADFPEKFIELRSKYPLSARNEAANKVGEDYFDIHKTSMEGQAKASELQDKEKEEQARLRAEFVEFGVSEEDQRNLLDPNAPVGTVRFDRNAALPVIAAAKQEKEQASKAETKTEKQDQDFTARLRDYQKTSAALDSLVDSMTAGMNKQQKRNRMRDPEIVKAIAAARATAAVLDLPQIEAEEDLKNYKKGDRVLAPDGITVITIQ